MLRQSLILILLVLVHGCGTFTLQCPQQAYVPCQNKGLPEKISLEGVAFILPKVTDNGISRKDEAPPYQDRMMMRTFNSKMLFHTELDDYITQAVAVELKKYGGDVQLLDSAMPKSEGADAKLKALSSARADYLLNITIKAFFAEMDATSLAAFIRNGPNTTRRIKLLVEMTHLKTGEQILSETVEDHKTTFHKVAAYRYQEDQCLVLGNYLLPVVLNDAMNLIVDALSDKRDL